MKKIKNILIVAMMVFAISNTALGQFIGKDALSISLFYMQKSELDSAQKYIDIAAKDEALKTQAKTWYYRGFIYKDIYKIQQKSDKQSPARIESINSFVEMFAQMKNDEFAESSAKILKYLASTLYNDAVRSLNPENYKLAITNFDLYKKTIIISNPNTDVASQDVKFKMALASMLNSPTDTEKGLDSAQTAYVKSLYLEVLSIDPDNPGANYNLATLYYNEAAEIINNMDYDMDIIKLNEIQDYCIEIFLKGLPYMKKAYELNYKRKETLIGLSNIYYGLNDIEKSEQYKKELEDLEKE